MPSQKNNWGLPIRPLKWHDPANNQLDYNTGAKKNTYNSSSDPKPRKKNQVILKATRHENWRRYKVEENHASPACSLWGHQEELWPNGWFQHWAFRRPYRPSNTQERTPRKLPLSSSYPSSSSSLGNTLAMRGSLGGGAGLKCRVWSQQGEGRKRNVPGKRGVMVNHVMLPRALNEFDAIGWLLHSPALSTSTFPGA